MSRFTGPVRWRVADGTSEEVVTRSRDAARKLMGALMARLNDGGIAQGVQRLTLPDGTELTARFDGTTPILEISAVGKNPAPEPPDIFNMWVPRGFVLYPAWSNAVAGVGMPVVQKGQDPFDVANLRPGLDPARWTVGGPLGEVLMSPDKDAGYPKQLQVSVPMMWYDKRGPVFHKGPHNVDGRDAKGPWKGYRLELSGFVNRDPDDQALQAQALFESVNDVRTNASKPAAFLWPRGFGNPAAITARMMKANGTTDADSNAYPPTYQHPYDRITKEGYTVDWMGQQFAQFDRAFTFGMSEFRALGGSANDVVQAWNASGAVTSGLGSSVLAGTWCSGGYNSLLLASCDRWIHAGNQHWQSSNKTLPPISWHGFASLNLAWETYPAHYDMAHYQTAPLVPDYLFTDANTGDCWLNYPRTSAGALEHNEPVLSRHVYCRGRSMALAPRGGLVWAAGVMELDHADRMIVLVHHPEDQDNDYTHEGWTRYLRVWWVDIPRRAMRLAPEQVICGEAVNDPWAWQGGQLVDVGHMTPPPGGSIPAGSCSSLKYASVWRFSPDGSRAACLRDYGLYADYSILYENTAVGETVEYAGTTPRIVELAFEAHEGSVHTTVTFHPYMPAATVGTHRVNTAPDTQDTQNPKEFPAVPMAVDYDHAGNLMLAYHATVEASTRYTYVGTGNDQVRWASELERRVLVSAAHRTDGLNFTWSRALVASVTRAAFVIDGLYPAFWVDSTPNPSATCWPFTEQPVHGVRMTLDGELVDESWYACPDGAIFAPAHVCTTPDPGSSSYMIVLPLAASAVVQGFFAERFNQHVFSYQVSPTPYAVRYRDDSTPDGNCGCTVSIRDLAQRSHAMQPSELAPRGGNTLGGIPLPDMDWTIFAKVV